MLCIKNVAVRFLFPPIGMDEFFYTPLIQSEGYFSEIQYASSSSTPSSPTPELQPTSLHWFRMSCLRLHDNPALNASLKQSGTRFCGVFIMDPWFTSGEQKFGINRWRFLIECLHDLDRQLRSLNQQLYVIRGPPTYVLSKLCQEWNVRHLTYQISPEPHGGTDGS